MSQIYCRWFKCADIGCVGKQSFIVFKIDIINHCGVIEFQSYCAIDLVPGHAGNFKHAPSSYSALSQKICRYSRHDGHTKSINCTIKDVIYH